MKNIITKIRKHGESLESIQLLKDSYGRTYTPKQLADYIDLGYEFIVNIRPFPRIESVYANLTKYVRSSRNQYEKDNLLALPTF